MTTPAALRPTRRALLAWLATLPLAAPPAVAADFGRGLLWRIERRGVVPSWLFGTIHLALPAALEWPALERVLGAARLVLLEMLDDPASARRFAAASQLPPGASLRDVAGAATAERATALLATRYGVPPAAALGLKPWAVYLALSQPLVPAPGEIVDAGLRRLAQARGLPVGALETLDEQIGALEGIPVASQVALLDAIARDHDAAQTAIATLRALYLAEDLAGMLALQQQAAHDDPALRAPLADLVEHLLWRRNRRMVERLAPELRRGGVLAAMGALHLHGAEGIPARLQAEGWSVARVALG